MALDSPYKPGFGARPAVLVGRESQLARAGAVLTRVANSGEATAGSVVFTGARGLGKTVMLGVIGDLAKDRRFLVAQVSMDRISDNVQVLASAIGETVAPLHHRGASALWQRVVDRLAALSIEVNAGLVKIVSDAPTRTTSTAVTVQRQVLASLLQSAAQAAREKDHAGLVLLLDEFQETPTEQLVVLANAIQDATKAPGTPLVVFAAGLPITPELVMEAASFTERFDFRTLRRLDEAEAERALLEPATALGVRWAIDAAQAALDTAAGSPYLIQYIGDETWLQTPRRERTTITADQAEHALAQVRENLDNGMFRGRWTKSTPGEQVVLMAIARSTDPRTGVATTAEVSALMGTAARRWSMTRKALIDKGMVDAPVRGQLRFTMPGFAAYVQDQYEELAGAGGPRVTQNVAGELPAAPTEQP
jgi:hypothetical protein